MKELDSMNSIFNTLELGEPFRTILYGYKNFDNDSNLKVLTASINFFKQTLRKMP